MKATARVYAFSILWFCVGVFAGGLAVRDIDERQCLAELERQDAQIAAAHQKCDQAEEAKRFIETYRTAYQTCAFLSSTQHKAIGGAGAVPSKASRPLALAAPGIAPGRLHGPADRLVVGVPRMEAR